MSTIKIKHRLFEIVAEKEEYSLASFKGKSYELIKYDPKSEEGQNLVYFTKRIFNSGVKSPKLFLVDKKQGYIVKEHIEGKTIMEIISEQDLPDTVYSQLFQNAYIAKVNRITLNYDIDKWVLADNVLYYMSQEFTIYNEEKDLVKKYLRLWFKTKELASFLEKHNLKIAKNRMPDEYTINKEIVLMTVKYYK